MKKFLKIFTIFYILVLALFWSNSVLAASCSKSGATCRRYNLSNDIMGSYQLEIGTAGYTKYFLLSYDGFATSYEAKLQDGYNISDMDHNIHITIPSSEIDAVFALPDSLNVVNTSQTGKETIHYYFLVRANGGSSSTGGDDGTTNCKNPSATSCKTYSLSDNGMSYKIELGNGSSGTYFSVIMNDAIVGTGTSGNNYRVSYGKKIYVVYETSLFTNVANGVYPKTLNVYANPGDNGYVEYVINGAGTSSGSSAGATDGYGDDYLGEQEPDITYEGMDCYGLLGMPEDPNSPAYWLQLALQIMRYIAIAALLILSTIDFVMAITKQDNDALKKAIQTTVKRFIFAVILFFVPLLTEFIMDFFGVYGTCAL